MSIDAPEIIEVTETRISCDGGGDGEHPLIWLQIPMDVGYVECPYCDAKYILKDYEGKL